MPPSGQGIAALEMLNIMEQFPIKEWGHNSQKSLHLEIEAKKLAYADLRQYVGDPHATHIPTEALISKDLAKQRAKLITDKAACNVLPSDVRQGLARLSSDTTYLAVRWWVGCPGHRLPAAESRWWIHPGAGPAKYASPANASAAHHHSRVYAER
jgi:hypothetical protein